MAGFARAFAFDVCFRGDQFPRREALCTANPRPSQANIGRKFEWCFKLRDESNLNAAKSRRACYGPLSTQLPAIARYSPARQGALTLVVESTITIDESRAGDGVAATDRKGGEIASARDRRVMCEHGVGDPQLPAYRMTALSHVGLHVFGTSPVRQVSALT
jgi:hypothetical protein